MTKKVYFHCQGEEQLSKVYKIPVDDCSTTFLVLLNKFVIAYNTKFGEGSLRIAELQLESKGRKLLPTTKICDTEATDVHLTRTCRCEKCAFAVTVNASVL